VAVALLVGLLPSSRNILVGQLASAVATVDLYAQNPALHHQHGGGQTCRFSDRRQQNHPRHIITDGDISIVTPAT
jgi:hypothetical protein